MALDDPADLLVDAPALIRRLYGARAAGPDKDGNPAPSAIDLQVLIALDADPDLKVQEIADRLAIDVSTVSHSLKVLRARKLIREKRTPEHHKRRSRPLTAAGRRQTAKLADQARRLLEEHNAKPQG